MPEQHLKEVKPASYLLSNRDYNLRLSSHIGGDRPLRLVYKEIYNMKNMKTIERDDVDRKIPKASPRDAVIRRIEDIQRQIHRCERWYREPRLPKIKILPFS